MFMNAGDIDRFEFGQSAGFFFVGQVTPENLWVLGQSAEKFHNFPDIAKNGRIPFLPGEGIVH